MRVEAGVLYSGECQAELRPTLQVELAQSFDLAPIPAAVRASCADSSTGSCLRNPGCGCQVDVSMEKRCSSHPIGSDRRRALPLLQKAA